MRNIMLDFNQHIDLEWPDFVTPNNGVSNNSVLIIASIHERCGNHLAIGLKWVRQNRVSDVNSTLAPVIAWCRQATSHYPSANPDLCRHMS